MKDLYEVIGVAKTATDKEIKTAYRKLAHEFHPDKNPGNKEAEEKFKEINNAYSVLSDPAKKSRYDQTGSAEAAPEQNMAWEDILGRMGGFEDLFGHAKPRQPKGQDLKQTLIIDFIESIKGLNKDVDIIYPVVCATCLGSGAKNKESVKTCDHCKGHGKISRQQGFMQMITTCGACQGRGNKITEYCPDCKGRGIQDKKEKLNINIPAGIESGNMMKIAGRGAPSEVPGGLVGDLYLEVVVSAHPKFKRHGPTIRSEEVISYLDAILGKQISAQTVWGHVNLTIPPGSQPGDVLKIAGKGVNKADHLVSLKVKLPKQITPEERTLLEELRKEK